MAAASGLFPFYRKTSQVFIADSCFILNGGIETVIPSYIVYRMRRAWDREFLRVGFPWLSKTQSDDVGYRFGFVLWKDEECFECGWLEKNKPDLSDEMKRRSKNMLIWSTRWQYFSSRE